MRRLPFLATPKGGRIQAGIPVNGALRRGAEEGDLDAKSSPSFTPISACSAPPAAPAEPLSFEAAVNLFKEWGFIVEPGPQPEEITLIIDAPDHRNYSVCPAAMLPQIAAVALDARRRRAMAQQIQTAIRLAHLYPSPALAG